MVKISVFTEKFCSINDGDGVDVDNNGDVTSNDKNGESFPPCVLIDQVCSSPFLFFFTPKK